MQRLVLRYLLALVLFVIAVSLASKLVAGIACLFFQAGSLLIQNWIQGHYASRAFILGILAGLAPASLCFTVFFWFARDNNPNASRISRFVTELNIDSAQPWTWMFFSPLMVLIVRGWIESQGYRSSVFQSTSPYSIASFVEYWNSELKYLDTRSHLDAVDWDWMQQVLCIWLLAASAGYSLAPLLRKLGFSAYRSMYRDPDKPIGIEAQESTMNEKTDPK